MQELLAQVDVKELTQWAVKLGELAAHYVFWSSIIVNVLAGIELVCRTIEDWAIDSDLPGVAARFKSIGHKLAIITDLVDRLGAINFKNSIRPKRLDKRFTDGAENSKAASA